MPRAVNVNRDRCPRPQQPNRTARTRLFLPLVTKRQSSRRFRFPSFYGITRQLPIPIRLRFRQRKTKMQTRMLSSSIWRTSDSLTRRYQRHRYRKEKGSAVEGLRSKSRHRVHESSLTLDSSVYIGKLRGRHKVAICEFRDQLSESEWDEQLVGFS